MLENALNTFEHEKLNDLSELFFSLPDSDPKAVHIKAFELVRWKEAGAFYRILDKGHHEEATGTVEFGAEHVIATLIDDVIFPTMQLDNLTTRECIERVLALQKVKHWVLGDCEFSRRFSYFWSCENLLTALFSIPNRFDQEFQWVFDTKLYPWKLHLRQLNMSKRADYYIHKGKNLLRATKQSDNRQICTILYPLGYGEGINQLDIKSVNNGLPFLKASPEAIKKYGEISRVWIDQRFEIAQHLKERGQVILDAISDPYESYEVGVAEIEKRTGQDLNKPEAGKIIKFDDFQSVIIAVQRNYSAVGADIIQVANAPEDVASSIADIADRQRINSVYAQGATSIYAANFADNADPQNPALLEFHIPSEARQINKVILSWKLDSFRAYSTGSSTTQSNTTSTSSGGATTTTPTSSSGGGSSTTSSDGGGGTSSGGGGGTSSSSSKSTTDSTTLSGGSTTLRALDYSTGEPLAPADVAKKLHVHTVVSPETKHAHDMQHDHTTKSHSHGMPSHSHKVEIQNHTHTLHLVIQGHNHTITIPGHSHKIVYGIYRGPRASAVTLRVDGVAIPVASNNIDIVKYLKKDGSGKITRGTNHTVEIIPNGLTRITATLYAQIFIQSEGGGNY